MQPTAAKVVAIGGARPAISLLVIEDNPGTVDLLSNAVAEPGLEILTASGPEEGLDLFRRRRPHIVLTDLMMPRMNGLELLERIMEVDPATDVVLMSGQYSTESAVEAVRKGASDFLCEPVCAGPLRARIARLVEEAGKRQHALHLEDELRTNSEFEGIVGRSPQMWEMFWRIRRVAPHYRAVLITGETGTGKDMAARAVHRLSPVASGHYVVLNCSAIVETLFESKLFWPRQGFVHGAIHDKPGCSNTPMGARCFWMRLETCRSAPRRNCCACSRIRMSSEWRLSPSAKWTFVSLLPPITTCGQPSLRNVFGRTYTIAFRWLRSGCRGEQSAKKTSITAEPFPYALRHAV
jgi:CheY-like chemotaxis protein